MKLSQRFTIQNGRPVEIDVKISLKLLINK